MFSRFNLRSVWNTLQNISKKKMALNTTDYAVKYPPNYLTSASRKNIPIAILFGWLNCQQKHLDKYSAIYEKRGYVTLTYRIPARYMFIFKSKVVVVGELLVRLLDDLKFEGNPAVVHVFSNGGSLSYQNFLSALQMADEPHPVQIKGVIFDSCPAEHRPMVFSLYLVLSPMVGGNSVYNSIVTSVAFSVMSILYVFQMGYHKLFYGHFKPFDPWERLLNENSTWPQLAIYSKDDKLIPAQDVETFIAHRKKLGTDITTLCFENSIHVGHLQKHKEAYLENLENFLNKCQMDVKEEPKVKL